MKKNIVVALSGTGRSLKNLVEYTRNSDVFQVAGVVSSSKKALGLEIAREYGIEVFYESFSKSSVASPELSCWLRKKNPDLIALAGFLKVFPTKFPGNNGEWASYKTVNIHPSLLPKFSGKGMYGQKVHEAVLQAGEDFTGVSLHFVTDVYDEGPLIAQVKVPVKENDSVSRLSSRVFEAECKLYPYVIEGLLLGSLPKKETLMITINDVSE